MADQAIETYLADQPEDRRVQMEAVRALINKHLPSGYEEVFNWGMITWQVPLIVYPDTYNKKPLMYLGLANNKKSMTLTLFGLYCFPDLKNKFLAEFKQKTGKKADMGAGCLRYKSNDDLPMDTIAWTVGCLSVDQMVKNWQARTKK